MIVAMLVDMMQTNLRQLGWAYFVFADRCRTNGWRCAVEQKYLTWQLSDQHKSDLYGAQFAWDFSFTPELEDIQQQIDVIPAHIFEQYRQKYGALAVYHMLTEPMPELEAYLNDLFDRYEEAEPIEGIVVYPITPKTVRDVAEARNIPLFVLEVGPMRWPLYTGSAYLTHCDQLSTDPGECKALYQRFLDEWREKKLPLLSREQILAIYLEEPYLPCLRYLNIPGQSEALLIGNGVNGKSDWPMNWDQTVTLADKLRRRFGENIRARLDLREPYGASFGMAEEQYAQDSPNIVSLLRSKRAVCAGSNMMFEAMLWNRPVYCDTKDHGLYFICNHTDHWADEPVPLEFLNFFAFVYVAPMDIATQDEYIRWRMSEPSMEEIYYRHLNRFLGRWGMTAEDIYCDDPREAVDRITRARGRQESFYPRDDLPEGEAAWEALFAEISYDPGPVAARLNARRQAAEALERTGAELAAARERLSALQSENASLQAVNADMVRTNAELTEGNARLDAAVSALNEEKDRLLRQIERCEDENVELGSEVAGLRVGAASMQDRIVALYNEMTWLQGERDALKGSVEALTGSVNTLTEKSAGLETELDSWMHSHSIRLTAPLRNFKHAVWRLLGKE